MRRALIALGLLLATSGDGAAATLPPHRPLRILVVSDEVNPWGLPPDQLTQPGDISAALLTPGNGLTLDTGAEAVVEVPTDQIELATARLALPPGDPAAYDALIYFAHRIPASGADPQGRQDAFVAAVDAFLQAGGGVVSFHHGAYASAGKQGILDLIGGTAAGGIAWDTTTGQNVIAVASTHFVASNGVAYEGTIAYADPARGVAAGDYPFFNNTPDERYLTFDVNATAAQVEILFASDYTQNGSTHLLGFTHRRPGWTGAVVAYQPGEYQPNALDVDGPNFQVLCNALVWSSGAILGGSETLAVGLGPDPSAAPRVRGFSSSGLPTALDVTAYGTTGYGVNAGAGGIDGAGDDELLTGPGPSPTFGPQVRAFFSSGQPVAKVSFYAYGTLKYGVRAEAADLDGDAIEELLSAPGPGSVFGPHVRAFDYDGASLRPIARINFFAFGTLKYGARVHGGSMDPEPAAEIAVAPGPGAVFGAQIRGFDYDGTVLRAIGKVSFVALPGLLFGAEVALGDVDGDGMTEILAGPGADLVNPSRAVGFDYDGAAIAPIPGFDVDAFGLGYGVLVGSSDVDADGRAELVAMPADPAAAPRVRGFDYEGGVLTPIGSVDFVADPSTGHGGNVEPGAL